MPAESCCMTTHLTSTISSCKPSSSPSILHPVQIREQSPDNLHSYLVPLTIAPAFLASALYLCLSRIIIVYGQQISRFSPRTYAITFMTSDFISLVLQGAGGGLAATADNHSESETGRAIMVAGLCFKSSRCSSSWDCGWNSYSVCAGRVRAPRKYASSS